MSNDGDFVTVRPREVRLTHRETAPDERRFTLPSLTTLAAGGGIVALLVVVFLFAPSFAPSAVVGAGAVISGRSRSTFGVSRNQSPIFAKSDRPTWRLQ